MTVDLATIGRETFDAHMGEKLVMRVNADVAIDLEILETMPLSTPAGAPRKSFLVRFRAAEKRAFPQQIYALEHPVLGTMEIFLVPSGPDAVGMRYDAVFS